MVLWHELAHLRRWDNLVNLFSGSWSRSCSSIRPSGGFRAGRGWSANIAATCLSSREPAARGPMSRPWPHWQGRRPPPGTAGDGPGREPGRFTHPAHPRISGPSHDDEALTAGCGRRGRVDLGADFRCGCLGIIYRPSCRRRSWITDRAGPGSCDDHTRSRNSQPAARSEMFKATVKARGPTIRNGSQVPCQRPCRSSSEGRRRMSWVNRSDER